jgi:hypothetical protein
VEQMLMERKIDLLKQGVWSQKACFDYIACQLSCCLCADIDEMFLATGESFSRWN